MAKLAKENKIIVILGPTSSGKTSLGVKLAFKFNGEIISADSRQVYKGMDIGTGKDLKDYRLKFSIFPGRAPLSGAGNFQPCLPAGRFSNKLKKQNSRCKIKKPRTVKIPYHLIDVVSPQEQFSLAKFKRLAERAIADIIKRGKTPIIVGGTGLYLQALVDNYNLSAVGPDRKLRLELEKKNARELFGALKKLDAGKAESLSQSDRKNKRRLIRYIEIRRQTTDDRRQYANEVATEHAHEQEYKTLILGLTWPREVLKERIYKRLVERLEKEDMIGEVERLHKEGVSWKRLAEFGLEYKFVSQYLRGKLDYEEMVEKLNIAIRQFAKRQMTWFRRWEKQGARIYWIKNRGEAEKLVNTLINAKER